MNYLAHIFLSGKNHEIIVGNILEDYVSGNIDHERNNHLSINIKKGLELHRIIDTFTDSHEVVKCAKNYFYEDFGKFAPIIVDVLFDHYIIKYWDKFSKEKFEDFRPRVYSALSDFQEIQPEKMKEIVKSMINHDWLKNYSERWGLEKAFLGLNMKINKSEIDLIKSLDVFYENYEGIGDCFLDFFPLLQERCNLFLKENKY